MCCSKRGIVHPVDVISRENQGILGAAPLQQVQVLVDWRRLCRCTTILPSASAGTG